MYTYTYIYISLVVRSGRPKALHGIYIVANVSIFLVKNLWAMERLKNCINTKFRKFGKIFIF